MQAVFRELGIAAWRIDKIFVGLRPEALICQMVHKLRRKKTVIEIGARLDPIINLFDNADCGLYRSLNPSMFG